MVTYRATNLLSGQLKFRLSNGEFIMLLAGESILLNEDNVKVVKDHEGIRVEELIDGDGGKSKLNSYVRKKRKRGK